MNCIKRALVGQRINLKRLDSKYWKHFHFQNVKLKSFLTSQGNASNIPEMGIQGESKTSATASGNLLRPRTYCRTKSQDLYTGNATWKQLQSYFPCLDKLAPIGPQPPLSRGAIFVNAAIDEHVVTQSKVNPIPPPNISHRNLETYLTKHTSLPFINMSHRSTVVPRKTVAHTKRWFALPRQPKFQRSRWRWWKWRRWG